MQKDLYNKDEQVWTTPQKDPCHDKTKNNEPNNSPYLRN